MPVPARPCSCLATLPARVYQQAEQVVDNMNARVTEAKTLMDALRSEGALKGGLIMLPTVSVNAQKPSIERLE